MALDTLLKDAPPLAGMKFVHWYDKPLTKLSAPLPELMDRKKRDIMERKGDKEDENNDKNSKKRAAPPRYDEAFRAGAVRMVTEQGRPSKEVAQELGICIDTLRSWLKAAGVQMGQADRQNRNARRERELEAEVRALRKKLVEKDEVFELLKNPSA